MTATPPTVPLPHATAASGSGVGDLPLTTVELPEVRADASDLLEVDADLLVVPVFKGGIEGPGTERVLTALGMDGPPITPSFRGDIGQTLTLVTPALRAAGVMFVGLGRMDATDDERLRTAAQIATRAAGNVARLATTLAQLHLTDRAVSAVAEGFLLASPRPTMRSRDDHGPSRLSILVPSSRVERSQAAVGRAVAHARAAIIARALVDLPPGDKRPPTLADVIARLLADVGEVVVHDAEALAAGGYGGILGVGRGSGAPPRLVEARYRPTDPLGSVTMVGKGVTFDSGGLSLKRGAEMTTMKSDMAGAAAVVGAMSALPALGVRLEVTALLPLAENMPGADAGRPGDVLTLRDGTTVEVVNTDAEGRLLLADALARATESSPDVVIDVATLTGSAIGALGPYTGALFATDEHVAAGLTEAARTSGESIWRLPFDDRLEERLASPVADVRNLASSPAEGGAITAAMFLRRFVGSTPFAHLDIAGPAFRRRQRSDAPEGATGYGARLLLEWLEQGR